jgi:hypothetical protein
MCDVRRATCGSRIPSWSLNSANLLEVAAEPKPTHKGTFSEQGFPPPFTAAGSIQPEYLVQGGTHQEEQFLPPPHSVRTGATTSGAPKTPEKEQVFRREGSSSTAVPPRFPSFSAIARPAVAPFECFFVRLTAIFVDGRHQPPPASSSLPFFTLLQTFCWLAPPLGLTFPYV